VSTSFSTVSLRNGVKILFLVERNTKTLSYAKKEVGVGVKTERDKLCLLSPHRNAGQNNNNTKIANKSFENVATLQYFGMTLANQNFIHEQMNYIW
jgi:hypothetical protein